MEACSCLSSDALRLTPGLGHQASLPEAGEGVAGDMSGTRTLIHFLVSRSTFPLPAGICQSTLAVAV